MRIYNRIPNRSMHIGNIIDSNFHLYGDGHRFDAHALGAVNIDQHTYSILTEVKYPLKV